MGIYIFSYYTLYTFLFIGVGVLGNIEIGDTEDRGKMEFAYKH